jgi:hypothetical protein
MAGSWVVRRVLIVVRTYPVPARSTIEASCTAAIGDDGQWVRMFPVPARLMEQDKRFSKWQWINVGLLKAYQRFSTRKLQAQPGLHSDS